MSTQLTNRHQWRIEMAHSIFTAYDGDIDKAMKHEKMPYKAKETVRKLAREREWYKELGIGKPKKAGGLKEWEIERIHREFIKANGVIKEKAQRTGFGKASVSRYAKARGWHEELFQINAKLINKKAENGDSVNKSSSLHADTMQEKDSKEGIVELKMLRQLLFDEIMGNDSPEATNKPSLKIVPKTLSEAVKALIDIDKRISDREGNQQAAVSDQYQDILSGCAKIVGCGSGSESRRCECNTNLERKP